MSALPNYSYNFLEKKMSSFFSSYLENYTTAKGLIIYSRKTTIWEIQWWKIVKNEN